MATVRKLRSQSVWFDPYLHAASWAALHFLIPPLLSFSKNNLISLLSLSPSPWCFSGGGHNLSSAPPLLSHLLALCLSLSLLLQTAVSPVGSHSHSRGIHSPGLASGLIGVRWGVSGGESCDRVCVWQHRDLVFSELMCVWLRKKRKKGNSKVKGMKSGSKNPDRWSSKAWICSFNRVTLLCMWLQHFFNSWQLINFNKVSKALIVLCFGCRASERAVNRNSLSPHTVSAAAILQIQQMRSNTGF